MKNVNSKRVFSYLLQILLTLVLLLTVVACNKNTGTPNDGPEDEPDETVVMTGFPCSEQGAMDFIAWLLKNDLSEDVGAYLFNITTADFIKEVDYLSLFLFANNTCKLLYNSWDDAPQGFKKYLTDKEMKTWAESLETVDEEMELGVYIFSWDEVKTKIESIWGKDKIDFTSYYTSDVERGFFVSQNNYLVCFIPAFGFESIYPFSKIIDAQAVSGSTDRFVVRLQMIGVECGWLLDEEEVYDVEENECSVYDFYNYVTYYGYELGKPLDLQKTTMEQFLNAIKFKNNIGVIEVEVFCTSEGMRLGGRKATNKIVAYEKEDFGSYTVNTKSGLSLYFGPGTNYEAIVTIANGDTVEGLGYLNKNNDWIYIQYFDEHKDISYCGWVSKAALVLDN